MILINDIVDLLGSSKEYTNYWVGLCPFHNDHNPSLLVYKPKYKRDKGWFRCLACDASGTYEILYNALQGWTPPYNLSEVDLGWTGVELPAHDGKCQCSSLAHEAHWNLMDNDHHAWYLERRGIKNRIEPCLLGWHRGWITIPIRDKTGDVQGLVVRATDTVQEASRQRYMIPKNQPPLLYIPEWRLLELHDTLFITFGVIDALSLCELRVPACSPTCGKGSVQIDDLDFWVKDIVIVPDQGEDSAAITLANRLPPRNNVKILYLPYSNSIRDPNDFLRCEDDKTLQSYLLKYL